MATITATEPETAPPIPAYRRGSKLRLRNTLIGWSFILPNFIGFGAAHAGARSSCCSTCRSRTGTSSARRTGSVSRTSSGSSATAASGSRVVNTLYYSAMHIPLTIVVSLGLALLLNNKLRGVAFFRTAAFFPYITSIVAIAVVWNLLFSPEYGPINEFLRFIGIQNPPGWLTSPEWAMPAVVIVEHVARHGLLHDPVPRRPADRPARAARGRARRRRERVAAVRQRHAPVPAPHHVLRHRAC